MTDTVDVLAVGAHPDDVEWGCGGTLAAFVAGGASVAIVHLTSGELGTRGSAEQRRDEARGAAEILGTSPPVFLDCRDGGLLGGTDQENALIDEIRRFRPRLVLMPPPSDRHPDHTRAHQLVRDACFYAGLSRRATGSSLARRAHRPLTQLHYFLHDALASFATPSLVVDVSATWQTKKAALECYASQFGSGDAEATCADSAETVVSQPAFWAAIEGRSRAFGQQIGVEMGEPLGSLTPLAFGDVSRLLDLGRP